MSEPTTPASMMTEHPISDPSVGEPTGTPPRKPTGTARKVFAAILDFIFIFWVAGLAIGYFSGGLTKDGFSLNGGPALLSFAVIILYFVVGRRYLGGTLFQRLLRAY